MVKRGLGWNYAPSSNELTATAGLALFVGVLRKLRLPQAIRSRIRVKKIASGFREDQFVVPTACNIALGRTDYNDVEWLGQEKKFLHRTLGYSELPKERTLAGHFEQYGEDHLAELRRLVAEVAARGELRAESWADGSESIPLDIDPSHFEQYASQREGVKTNYGGTPCYTPVFAWLGVERFCIHHRLQEGRTRSVAAVDSFLEQTVALLPRQLDRHRLLVRLDAEFYSHKTVRSCEGNELSYIVKARASGPLEDLADAELEAERCEVVPTPWGGEFYGEFTYTPDGWEEPRRFVCCVQTRVREEATGQQLLIEDVRYWTLVTNLPVSVSPREVFARYRKRGAAEEPNKELKYDLNLEQLPSQTFRANEVMLAVGLLAYNVLVLLGQQWIDPCYRPARGKATLRGRRRIKTLQDVLLRSAAAVVTTGRRYLLRVAPWWLERVRPQAIERKMEQFVPLLA